MSKNRKVGEIVQTLKKIYEETFGGKDRGRYKITRPNLRKLCGLSRLEETTIKRIVDAALEEGFVLIEVGDYFCMVEESVMLNYRPVPKNVGRKYLPNESSSRSDADDDDGES
jgi:hypothetical protein